jgi:hypothetical protein
MTTSGSAARHPGRHVAGPTTSPGIDGPPEDAHDEGAPQGAPPADARTGPPGDVQELKHEIEQTREQLGETVERLVAKADVSARARDKAAELTGRAAAIGGPVWGAAPEPVRQAVAKGADGARRHAAPLAMAAGMLILGYLTIRWRRRR